MSDNREITNESIEIVVHKFIEGKYDYPVYRTVLEKIKTNNYKFSPQELRQLINPTQASRTPVIDLASVGYFFTMDELKCFGSVNGISLQTVARYMVMNGFIFSTDELLTLGNPTDNTNWTVSHEMAKYGFNFSVDSLIKLDNPSNTNGLTVADVMVLNGYQFTEDEEKKLGIDRVNFTYSAFGSSWIEDDHPFHPTLCPKCGGKLGQSRSNRISRGSEKLTKGIDLYCVGDPPDIFSCEKCFWWCIHEEWLCWEAYNLSGNLLIFGVAKSKTEVTIENSQPWEKALNDEFVYDHLLLNLPRDIRGMFLE